MTIIETEKWYDFAPAQDITVAELAQIWAMAGMTFRGSLISPAVERHFKEKPPVFLGKGSDAVTKA